MKNILRYTAYLLLLLLYVSCQDESGLKNEDEQVISPNKFVPIPLNTSERMIAVQNLDFAFRLFQETNTTLTNSPQIVVSPLSAFWALSMVSEGTQDTTLQEFMQVLGCKETSQTALHEYNKKLASDLTEIDNTIELNIANSVWIDEDLQVSDSYTKNIKDLYETGLFNTNFSSPSSVKSINEWCTKETGGHITKIMEYANPDLRLLLLSAIYFKGAWSKEFNKINTKKEAFVNFDASTTNVEYMSCISSLKYMENEYFSMIELPYGNEAYNMTILLPNVNVNIDQCINTLDVDIWDTDKIEQRNIYVKLPKFKLESNLTLNDILISMGLKDAFSDTANFDRLTKEEIMLSAVEQSVYFSINEKGTEASTTTSVEVGAGSNQNSGNIETINFHVNRPFVFMIKEQSTHSILFIGKITQL